MSEQNEDKRQMVQAQYPLSELYQIMQYASSPIKVSFCMRDVFSLPKGLLFAAQSEKMVGFGDT